MIRLILASRSPIRASLLAQARVRFEVVPPRLDEAALKGSLLAEGAPPRDVADSLAEMKARRVAAKHPDALVLGLDQVLTAEGRLFDKPRDLTEAATHLRLLRGRQHTLLSAAVICRADTPLWRHVGAARLWMRAFSDEFLDGYLSSGGEEILESVGAYKLEAGGAQLFDRIEGDYFTILGLPLLPILAFLRLHGTCPT
jgi:septum formation protein